MNTNRIPRHETGDNVPQKEMRIPRNMAAPPSSTVMRVKLAKGADGNYTMRDKTLKPDVSRSRLPSFQDLFHRPLKLEGQEIRETSDVGPGQAPLLYAHSQDKIRNRSQTGSRLDPHSESYSELRPKLVASTSNSWSAARARSSPGRGIDECENIYGLSGKAPQKPLPLQEYEEAKLRKGSATAPAVAASRAWDTNVNQVYPCSPDTRPQSFRGRPCRTKARGRGEWSCEPVHELRNEAFEKRTGGGKPIAGAQCQDKTFGIAPQQSWSSKVVCKRTPSGSEENEHLPTPPVPSPPPTSRKASIFEPPGSSRTYLPRENDPESDCEFDRVYKSLPRNVCRDAAKRIFHEQVKDGMQVRWGDIAGLSSAKQALKEATVYPLLRPDLFCGLREPSRGVLLFGPPGTGKTMLARAVATESKSTFFAISASTLCGMWHGESEKLVRAMFALAKEMAPSVLFIDEIDSILSARNGHHRSETSEKIKTEFLIQWSSLNKDTPSRNREQNLDCQLSSDSSSSFGKSQPKALDSKSSSIGRHNNQTPNLTASDVRGNSKGNEGSRQVLVLAATNLPWNIDTAAIRRFSRRQYIPLPEWETRKAHLYKLLESQDHLLTIEEIEELADRTEGYSGSDITQLARSAAMEPLRSMGDSLLTANAADIPKLSLQDFISSLEIVKPSVPLEMLNQYLDWAKSYAEKGI